MTGKQAIELGDRLILGGAARSFRQQVERQLALSQPRPDPPRGVRVEANTLKWDAPQDARGVTHYLIYVDDDSTVKRQVGAEQKELNETLTGRAFYVRSANAYTGWPSSPARYDAGSEITIGPDDDIVAIDDDPVTY